MSDIRNELKKGERKEATNGRDFWLSLLPRVSLRSSQCATVVTMFVICFVCRNFIIICNVCLNHKCFLLWKGPRDAFSSCKEFQLFCKKLGSHKNVRNVTNSSFRLTNEQRELRLLRVLVVVVLVVASRRWGGPSIFHGRGNRRSLRNFLISEITFETEMQIADYASSVYGCEDVNWFQLSHYRAQLRTFCIGGVCRTPAESQTSRCLKRRFPQCLVN